jgi:hypothetical protein
MAVVGFSDIADARARFEERYRYLAEHHWQPFQQAGNDPARQEQLRERSWADYQALYHQRLT